MGKVVGFAIEEPRLNYSETILLLREEYQTIPHGRSIEIVDSLGQQAEGLRRLSKLEDSQALFNKALFIARKSGISWGECWALWGLGAVLRTRGSHNLSRRMFRCALSSAKQARNKRCALWSYAELSELDRIAGRLGHSLAVHKTLRDEFQSIGDWKGVCWAILGIAQIYRLQRELMQASIEFRAAYEVSSLVGNVIGAAWAIRGYAEVAKENGDTLLAIKLALEARAQFSAIGYKLGAAYALKTQVEALLSDGRITESLSIARQCREEFEVCGERRGVGFSLLTLGTIWARLDEPFHAIPLLQQSQLLLASSGGSEPNGFSPTAELRRIFTKYGNIK